jgi:hypothetical protein
MPAEEGANLAVRAKLFARVSSAWATRGAGTLKCNRTAGKRRIELVDEDDGSSLLDVDVGQVVTSDKADQRV